uniref:Uncharacterized protein n=1 Tax=uncultured virus TaxID=340016 RepID=D5L275_9VIRU|nr:hypothetical protein [uncultured virus]
MTENNPEISVDLGIAKVSFVGGEDDSFDDLFDNLDAFLDSETLEETVLTMKKHDFKLDEEYDVSADGGDGSTGFR